MTQSRVADTCMQQGDRAAKRVKGMEQVLHDTLRFVAWPQETPIRLPCGALLRRATTSRTGAEGEALESRSRANANTNANGCARSEEKSKHCPELARESAEEKEQRSWHIRRAKSGASVRRQRAHGRRRTRGRHGEAGARADVRHQEDPDVGLALRERRIHEGVGKGRRWRMRAPRRRRRASCRTREARSVPPRLSKPRVGAIEVGAPLHDHRRGH